MVFNMARSVESTRNSVRGLPYQALVSGTRRPSGMVLFLLMQAVHSTRNLLSSICRESLRRAVSQSVSHYCVGGWWEGGWVGPVLRVPTWPISVIISAISR